MLTKHYCFGKRWKEFCMPVEVLMNLPEIFVQLLKVAVSLPNDYLKHRKRWGVLVGLLFKAQIHFQANQITTFSKHI